MKKKNNQIVGPGFKTEGAKDTHAPNWSNGYELELIFQLISANCFKLKISDWLLVEISVYRISE